MKAFIRLTEVPEVAVHRVVVWCGSFNTNKLNSFVPFALKQSVFRGPFQSFPTILATLKERNWLGSMLPGEPSPWHCAHYDVVRSSFGSGESKEEEWIVDDAALIRRRTEGWVELLKEDFLSISTLFSHTLKRLRLNLHSMPVDSFENREQMSLVRAILFSLRRFFDG